MYTPIRQATECTNIGIVNGTMIRQDIKFQNPLHTHVYSLNFISSYHITAKPRIGYNHVITTLKLHSAPQTRPKTIVNYIAQFYMQLKRVWT